MTGELDDGHGHLLRNMVLFGRLLRAGGLDVTPIQITDWLSALELIELGHRADFMNSARSILVRRRDDLTWFEAAFDLFWQARDPRQLAEMELGLLIQKTTERTARTAYDKSNPGAANTDDNNDGDEPRLEPTATFSAREMLKQKDFAELTPRETEAIKRLMAEMSWSLDSRRTRRKVADRRGRFPDMRRTLRRNLARGGEIMSLARRSAKHRPRPLVLLCDISGSMEPYSRLLLHFVYAMGQRDSAQRGLERVEAFVFGTRLTRITPHLRERDIDASLRAATREIADWGGGTRTGESLKAFNYVWSRRVLGQGAVVLIISDGWDRGDIDLLSAEMERLRKSCHRLLWLNPLLGSPSYRPLTRGMQAALPFVDDFLPVHNLHSLEQLADALRSFSVRNRPQSSVVSRR